MRERTWSISSNSSRSWNGRLTSPQVRSAHCYGIPRLFPIYTMGAAGGIEASLDRLVCGFHAGMMWLPPGIPANRGGGPRPSIILNSSCHGG